MKVMMTVWIAVLAMAYLVSGHTLEQALLAGKIVIFGFVLGFLGAKVADLLQAYRDVKPFISPRRR